MFGLKSGFVIVDAMGGRVVEFSWRASEASETLSGLFNRESRYIIVRMSHLPFDP